MCLSASMDIGVVFRLSAKAATWTNIYQSSMQMDVRDSTLKTDSRLP